MFGLPQNSEHGILLFKNDLADSFLDEVNTHELQRIVKKGTKKSKKTLFFSRCKCSEHKCFCTTLNLVKL